MYVTHGGTIKRATAGHLFNADEYRDIQRQNNADIAEAIRWLSLRFNDVREEEVGILLAQEIQTIMKWQEECAICSDIKRCSHSRAVLEIEQEYDSSGFRQFVVRARACDVLAKHEDAVEQSINFDNSGIPAERQSNTFEGFKIAAGAGAAQLLKAIGTAKECAARNMGVILGGSVGCGKTHLAIAMGIFALKDNRKVRFHLMPELLEKLKNDSWDHDNKLYEEVKRCDLLILDDAGTENTTNWKDERLFMLINYRYDHKLPIVITTNAVGSDGLKKVLDGGNGERIYSRLMEMTVQVWLREVPDYRQKKKAQGC